MQILQPIHRWLALVTDKVLNRKAAEQKAKSERQRLVDVVFDSFKESLWDDSTDESLLFNTCFHVYVSKEVYDRQEQMFSFTVKDVMRKINRHIIKMTAKFPDYTPHANYWLFQFSPLNSDGELDTSLFKVEDHDQSLGHDGIPVISTLYAPEDNRHRNDYQRVVATVHSKDSISIKNWNINLDTLRDMEVMGTSLFRFKFTMDASVSELSSETRRNHEPIDSLLAVATLTAQGGKFIRGDQMTRAYNMVSDKLYVYGRIGEPETGDKEIARLDSDEVLSPHVIIKRTPQGTFLAQAKGETVINEVTVNNMDAWTPLPNNSTILINGRIQLHFLIAKHHH